MSQDEDQYLKPLETTFNLSLKEAKRHATFDDSVSAALKDYFMMGAISAMNILMTGYTFPDGQDVSYSANELSQEAFAFLRSSAGKVDDESDDDDEDGE